jgi:outer membrane protein OmpU
MNNSTRNLKMKKLLIATTALVATAGMASADITITGAANAGYYSGLSKKDGTAKVTAVPAVAGAVTAAQISAHNALSVNLDITAAAATSEGTADSLLIELLDDRAAEVLTYNDISSPSADEQSAHTAAMASFDAMIALARGTAAIGAAAASVGTYTDAGIYSNAGVVATMTGATDGGITFSASIDAEAGTEVDTGDFELDGAASGAFGLGSVSMTGGFGTVTFDDNGIDNLYDDDLLPAHDVSYATTVGGMGLTVATNAQQSANQTSVKATYTSGAMTFTGTTTDQTAGTAASLAVSYVVSDSLTVRADTDQAAGKEAVQSIGLTTALNGISIVADSSNNSTWDVSLGYTVNGVALTYANDEADAWSASASYALGGGATAKAGINAEDSMYAGVSFAF